MSALGLGVAIAAVAVAALVSRHRALSRLAALERAQPARAVRPDGVVVGAEAMQLHAPGERHAMILHGFNDTPQSVAAIARVLNARGWNVSVPLLPGHGRADDFLDRTAGASEWIAAARSEWRVVRARSPHAVLCGQSMGGALAAIIAVTDPPAALVLLAPYLAMNRAVQLGALFWRLWSFAVPVLLSDPRRGFRDDAARSESLGRGRFSPKLVAQLRRVVRDARLALPRVTVPTLVVHARADYRIPSASALGAFARLGARDKTLEWRNDSGHVLGGDRDRDAVGALVADWLASRT